MSKSPVSTLVPHVEDGPDSTLPLPIADPAIKQLVMAGVNAARDAGAHYAEVRLSHQKKRDASVKNGICRWTDQESMTVSVRAIVNGYWGFAADTLWNIDDVIRLSRAAVSFAKENSVGSPRNVELASVDTVVDQHWGTPVKRDPFEVSRAEIADFLIALEDFSTWLTPAWETQGVVAHFTVTDKAFGSTGGTYFTQRLHETAGGMNFRYRNKTTRNLLSRKLDNLSVAGLGWEMFSEQPLREMIRKHHDEMIADSALPLKPVDIGRYDIVFDAATIVDVINSSIGAATQLDRALGYEANAGGTSYLNNPSEMLGTFKIGRPDLNITANRSAPAAVATVKWDDEGVSPTEFALVRNGILAGYSTMREGAGWLHGMRSEWPVRSTGCAAAPQAVDLPLAHTPNLVMQPADSNETFQTLVKSMKRGIAVMNGSFDFDFQQLNGLGDGEMYEVSNGARVTRLVNGGTLIRAPEFWKSVKAIGGPQSQQRFGTVGIKGEPPQRMSNSVDVVPMMVGEIALIDKSRKA